MSLFLPDFDFRRIHEIPTEFFKERGIHVLLLDVDNTLTKDNSQEVSEEVVLWLEKQKAAGLHLFVLSNNEEARVAPFAHKLGLDYIAKAGKPKTSHLKARMEALSVTPEETALIGDQLFTDILCGNLGGCTTIRVEPFALEESRFFRMKRSLERPFLRRYFKRKERKAGDL